MNRQFELKIDDEITHMFFFKGKNKDSDDVEFMDESDYINRHLQLMKKNYIYIAKILDNDGNDTGKRKVVYKNLGVKKKSTSALTRHIFKEILIPKILEEKTVRWDKSFFEKVIYNLLDENLDIAVTRYNVKPAETYKKATQLQAQIATKYGAGIHFLIKNDRLGAGIGSKYCSIEDFKNANMRLKNIDLSGVWSELGYFILPEKVASLADWGL